jgi:phenylalanyl-tRNA synthetase alpha subunit
MTSSKNSNDLMFDKFAEGLESTSKLTRILLSEIKESESDFASVKTELGILRSNVNTLKQIISEGNGDTSLITKIALIEKQLETIDKWIEKHVDIHQHITSDINEIRKLIDDKYIELEKQLIDLKNIFSQAARDLKEIMERSEKEEIERKSAYDLERNLEHEKKKAAISVKEERQKFLVKLLVSVIVGLIALSVGYFVR